MTDRTTAHQIFERVRDAGRRELERSSLGLAASGLSAGLNISFSFVAVAAILSGIDNLENAHLWSAVAYPAGFILVILARAQLFTENTLTPVIVVLARPGRDNIRNTIRLWAVVLVANLIGAALFALALARMGVAPALEQGWLVWAAEDAYAGEWGNLFLRAILGGWLIALMVWMLHAGADLVAEVALVWLTAFLIQAAGLSHSVAGAVEVLYLAHLGRIAYFDWAWHFQLPVTLGNIVGGVVFVALVNYAQAVGAGRDVEVARRLQRTQEAKDIRELEAADEAIDGPPPSQENRIRDE